MIHTPPHSGMRGGPPEGAFRLSPRSSRPHGGISRVVTLMAVIAIAFGGLVSAPSPALAASVTATASVNLRSGPGINYAVITVIPNGAAVETTGAAQSGFYPVTYNGRSGFVSADYLSSSGEGSGAVSGGSPTGTRYVFDGALNFRSGPSTADAVIGVLPNGAAVQLTGESANGFAGVTYNGRRGWAFAQYLGSGGGTSGGNTSGGGSVAVGDSVTGTATVTSALNLRQGPGTSYGVIVVMRSGASVEVMGSAQAGFLPVRYNGVKGWASAEYLRTGGTTAPPPVETPPAGAPGGNGPVPVGSTVTDNQVTTSAVNLRQGPGASYAIVIVLPPGTQVDIMGSASGSYLPVRWAGRTGWAHGDWLTDPGSTAPAPDSGSQPTDIVQIIYAAADRWGQPRADMLRVARCESNLDPRAVNSSSGASGLFQFMPSTFAFTPNGEAGQDIFDPVASADAAGWMWANGMRNHWACQ